jgi:hypothetical protein
MPVVRLDQTSAIRIQSGRALLDPADQAVRDNAISQVEMDWDRLLSEYTERFGNVLNADNAAKLFPEYNRDTVRRPPVVEYFWPASGFHCKRQANSSGRPSQAARSLASLS